MPVRIWAAVLLALSGSAMGAQPAEKPPPTDQKAAAARRCLANGAEATVFVRSDLAPAERQHFVATGPVSWSADGVSLAEGAELTREIAVGPVVDLDIRVRSKILASAAAAETWLTVGIGANGYAGAALVTQRTADGLKFSVAILAVNPVTSGEQQLRVIRSLASDQGPDARWTVRYNYGVVAVERNGQQVLVADTGLQELPVVGVRLRQPQQESQLSTFAVAGLTPAARPTEAELARKKQVLPEWEQASREALATLQQNDWQACLAATRRVQPLIVELFGAESLTALQNRQTLGLVYTQLDQTEQAATVYREAYESCRRKLGDHHTITARMLRDVGLTLGQQGRYQEASDPLRQAAETLREILGPDHPETAFTWRGLAQQYVNADRWLEAAKAYEEAIASHSLATGAESGDVASLREAYAMALEGLGATDAAQAQLQTALGIWERVEGPASRAALHAKVRLARILQQTGAEVTARALLESVRRDSRSGTVAAQLEGVDATYALAELHARLGDAELARQLAQEGRTQAAALTGHDSVAYAGILEKQASLLEGLGALTESAALLREAAAMLAKAGPRARRLWLDAIVGLVQCELMQGNYQAAEREGLRAATLLKEAEGNAGWLAQVHSLLGFSQLLEQRWDDAEKSFQAAADLLQPSNRHQTRELGVAWLGLAQCAEQRQQWTRALKLEDRALDLCRTVYGPKHRSVVLGLFSKALTYQLQGDWARAADLQRQSLDIELDLAQIVFGSLSEAEAIRCSARLQALRAERLWLAREVRVLGEEALRGLLQSWPRPDAAAEYHVVWQTKAMATRMLGQRRAAVRHDPAAQPVLSQLATVRRELAQLLYADTPAPAAQDPEERLRTLTRAKEDLERQLAGPHRGGEAVEGESVAMPVEQLAAVLPADSVVVDFVEVARHLTRVAGRGENKTERYYDAFVLRSAGTPPRLSIQWVDLGPAEPIDALVADWGQQNGTRGQRRIKPVPAAESDEGRRLAELVWRRLEPLVKDARTIFVIPDGRLHRVPWAGLPDPEHEGQFLAERFAFVTAAYGQQLLRPPATGSSNTNQLLLVGNADFGGDDQPSPVWKGLPGTQAEVERIAAIAGGRFAIRRLEQAEASKAATLAALPGSRWIHLATHGFFQNLPAAAREAEAGAGTELFSLPLRNAASPGVIGRSPLLRAGLVFAGANAAASTHGLASPCILSGEELLDLDLSQTDLVVLSACETNVGVASGGEGLFALQRAFHGAGARTVVASLWKVDDLATAAFMAEFYRQLIDQRRSKVEAFRQAQLAMLRRYDPAAQRLRPDAAAPPSVATPRLPPAYWAAFVLSGDWR